jgi:transposase
MRMTASWLGSTRIDRIQCCGRPKRALRLHYLCLKGIGAEFAAALYLEGLFGHFENRRQLAAYAGLAPSPWKSGSVDQAQGISNAGNRRLRTTMIELAWMWVSYPPDSALRCWFRQRVGSDRGRIRRISIVALARKLLIALSSMSPMARSQRVQS